MFILYQNRDTQLTTTLDCPNKWIIAQSNIESEIKPYFYQAISDCMYNAYTRVDCFASNENTIEIATFVVAPYSDNPDYLEIQNIWIERIK